MWGGRWLVTVFALAVALSLGASACQRHSAREVPPGTPGPLGTPTVPAASELEVSIRTPQPGPPTPTPAPTATPTPIVYVVQKGDTLLAIASRFGVSVSELQEINGVVDPRTLQIGQELIIPPPDLAASSTVPTPTPVPVRVSGVSWGGSSVAVSVAGEVVNESGMPVQEVVVLVELLDTEEKPLAALEVPALVDTLAAAGKAPFAASFEGVSFPASVRARLLRAVPASGRAAPSGLALSEVSGRAVHDRTFSVLGKVRNTGKEPWATHVVLTVYGRGGQVVAARRELVSPALEPGAQAMFTISVVPLSWPVESFAIVAEAGPPAPEAAATPLVSGTSATP